MLNLTFEQKIKLYDTIIWGGLIYITIWLILKMAGVIQTPLWIEYSPALIGIISFGILLVKLGLYLGSFGTKLEYVLKRLDVMERDIKDLKKVERLNTAFRLRLEHRASP